MNCQNMDSIKSFDRSESSNLAVLPILSETVGYLFLIVVNSLLGNNIVQLASD